MLRDSESNTGPIVLLPTFIDLHLCYWTVRGSNPGGTRDFPHLSRPALRLTQSPLQWVDCVWNVMAHEQKRDFVFRRNVRVHLNRWGRQFSRLLAAEMCASAVVMLDTPCSEVVWRVRATHSIRQFPLHFPSCASPRAITFQLESTGSSPVGKMAGACRLPPTPSSAEVKERVELYIYSPSGPSWPVLGWTLTLLYFTSLL